MNGFTNEGHDLYLHGRSVSAKRLRIVADALLQFLTGLECVLIAHNCAFNAPRLMRLINQVNLVAEFTKIIDGFVDTLPLFRNKFPGEDCGLIKLAARYFALQPEQAHDVTYDIVMLHNVAVQHFAIEELLANNEKYTAMLHYDETFESLAPLENLVSNVIRKRMANAGISYAQLRQVCGRGKKNYSTYSRRKKTE